MIELHKRNIDNSGTSLSTANGFSTYDSREAGSRRQSSSLAYVYCIGAHAFLLGQNCS
jgi:hypothetical protein